MIRALYIGMAGLGALLISNAAARAADRYWQGGSGTWSDGTRWNTEPDGTGSPGVPQNGDHAYVRLPGDTNYSVTFNADHAPGVALAHLELDTVGGFAGFLDQTSGGMTTGGTDVGITGNAIYWQAGGQHDVNGALTLAKYAGSTGTYMLEGGSLYVVGDLAGGRGESFLHLRGGAISVGGALDLTAIYFDPTAPGTYSYNFGASPRVTSDTFWVGSAATTTLQHLGGQTQVNVEMNVASSWRASARYQLGGGLLANSGRLTIGAPIGNPNYSGHATFEHSGGTHTVNGDVSVGAFGGEAAYLLSDTASLRCGNLSIGWGRVAQSGGSAAVDDALLIARDGPSGQAYANTALYQLSGNGILSTNIVSVGSSGQAEATFLQSGGTHSASGTLKVGGGAATGATGLYDISGGQLTAANLVIANGGRLSISSATAGVAVTQVLEIEPGGALSAAPGTLVRMTGSAFVNQSTAPSLLEGLGNLTFSFEGGSSAPDPLEVAGRDFGPMPSGWLDNFALHELRLGADEGVVGRVQLVSAFDNRPDWIGIEALYVDHLALAPNSYLDLNGFNLYYKSYSNLGGTVVLNGGHLVAIPEPTGFGFAVAVGCHALHRRRQRRLPEEALGRGKVV